MYQLYYAPDNASLIVRMVLEELEAEYSTVLVDRSRQWQQSEEYRRLNPNGLIPVCIIDGQPVFETGAIILTLAERHRELVPTINDPERPAFLKWMFFLSNSVHTDQRQLFYPSQFAGDGAVALSAHRHLTETRIKQRLQILDNHCAQQTGPYLMDEEFTIADIYLATMLRWVQLYPIDKPCLSSLQTYPSLQRLTQAVAERSGVQKACTKEGISEPYFDKPSYANPPEGTAV